MTGLTYQVTVQNGITSYSTGIYDVKAYGAAADGVTEDAGAIQAAINAAELTGGQVYLPTGDYVVGTELVIDSANVTVSGSGHGTRLLTANTATKYWIQISAANVTLENFTMVGSITDTDTTFNAAIDVKSGGNTCTINKILFTGASASAGYSSGIWGRAGITDLKITECHAERIRGTASDYGYFTQIAGATGGVMSDNTSVFAAATGRHHYYISAGTSGFVISNNTCRGGTSSAISVYALAAQDPCKENVISNNTIYDSGAATSGAITLSEQCQDNVVIGNTIRDATGFGIYLNNSLLDENLGNVIANNIIVSPGDTGIYNLGGKEALITGNKIKDVAAAAGISNAETGTSTADNTMVIGNKIAGTTHTIGIICNGADLVVTGNRINTGTGKEIHNILQTNNTQVYDNFYDNDRVVTVTSTPHTALVGQDHILVDLASPFAVTIPAVLNYYGNKITVKDGGGHAGGSTITITTTAANIDGAATATITSAYGKVTIVSDGTNWFTV